MLISSKIITATILSVMVEVLCFSDLKGVNISGDDTMTGGTEDDLFIFAGEAGHDVIMDFVAGLEAFDVIELSGYGEDFDTFAEVIAAATEVITMDGTNVLITFDTDRSIEIVGVTIADLAEADFIFG